MLWLIIPASILFLLHVGNPLGVQARRPIHQLGETRQVPFVKNGVLMGHYIYEYDGSEWIRKGDLVPA